MTRARGEGSIRQRADGRWEGRYWTHDGHRRSVFGKTRTEASGKLRAALQKVERGIDPVPASGLLEAYLPAWLEAVRPSLKPQTASSYARIVRLHLIPHLGRTRMDRLTPLQIQQLYARLLVAGLSAKTVRNVHGVLHRALERAVDWGQLPSNVADLVDLPRLPDREMEVFDKGEVLAIISATQGDPLEVLYLLALTIGLREGELLALRWRDIHLPARRLSVTGSIERETRRRADPKSRASRRTVQLSSRLVEALCRHRDAQGPVLPSAWVFPAPDGRPMSEPALWHRWRRVTEMAGVRPLRFHDCRHTAATHMLARGVDVKTVSAILGHAKPSVTLNIYAHFVQEMQDRAVAAVDDLLDASGVSSGVKRANSGAP